MAPHEPWVYVENGDETFVVLEENLDRLDLDSDGSSDLNGPDIITIDDEDGDDAACYADLINPDIKAPDVEEQRYAMPNGTLVTPGTTVELKDRVTRPIDQLHSGDFLRVKHIIRNLETDEVRLRGFRLQRTKYQGQIFDWKMNELVLVLHTNENDPRSPFAQGLVDIPATEVLKMRECIMTNKAYPLQSFRDAAVATPRRARSIEDARTELFQHGRLVCRYVNISHIHTNGKSYGGVVRHLYSREADAQPAPAVQKGSNSCESSISIDEDDDIIMISDWGSNSKRSQIPARPVRYTFGDCFAGAGGASQGAVRADLVVTWGLDHDEYAIEAYGKNHPGAVPFICNAHKFPPQGATKELMKVDVLHLSPPCCYWSPAHTREGKNDQDNYEAIYTVGPILQKCKPRVATVEQTFGLLTHEEHKLNFMHLLNQIMRAGYDLRYKIADISEYGLPQRRKRLLIIATKRGTPLPPFPRPTHGGPGSGLKPFQSIADALQPLERLGVHALDDEYHQPSNFKAMNKDAYDPRTSLLKGCITTSGGENHHYSGTRKYTPRELALLQTFPYWYSFTGGQGEALKQIGNAFPPVMAEALYRTIAKTLEAFDNGLIGAEDDIDDLDAALTGKDAKAFPSKYLHGVEKTVVAKTKHSLWSRNNNETAPSVREKARRPRPFISRRQRQVLEEIEMAEEDGLLVELD